MITKSDYIDFLESLPSDSIDLLLTDPFYEIDYQGFKGRDFKGSVDWEIFFTQSKRILKPTGNLVVFNSWSNLFNLHSRWKSSCASDLTLRNMIVWDRVKTKNGGKKNFTSAREEILWFTLSDDYTFNKEDSTILKKTKGFGSKNNTPYRRLSNVWTDISPIMFTSKEYTGYPTQKPVALFRRLVRIFSNEGERVVDCFCGSGTTVDACIKENREYKVCDNSEEAIEQTKKRILIR